MSTPIRSSLGPSGIDHALRADTTVTTRGRAGAIDRWLAGRVQRIIAPAAVRLELWDGTSPYDGSPPLGSLVIRDRRTLIGLAFDPDLQFGEGYMSGRLEVRGPLEPIVEALTRLSQPAPSWRTREDLQPYADEVRRLHPPAARTPTPLKSAFAAAGRVLLGSSAFTRHVLLDRWFLRRAGHAQPHA